MMNENEAINNQMSSLSVSDHIAMKLTDHQRQRLEKPTDSAWNWPVDKPDIKVGFQVGLSGPGIYSVYLDYIIDNPMTEALSVSTDVERWADWVPTCHKLNNMTAELGENDWHQVGQIIIKLPLVFLPKKYKVREILLSGQYFTDETDKDALFMTFITHPGDDIPLPKGVPAECRMSMPDGISRIYPVVDKATGRHQTRITVFCDLDPKLPLPEGPIWGAFLSWLFNKIVPFAMRAFRKQASVVHKKGLVTPLSQALVAYAKTGLSFPSALLFRAGNQESVPVSEHGSDDDLEC
ncbi:hypothetical protein J8273_2765 [Carpediemonas membranifera]|uniref:START domain-containing protein n=1 Tax=Carpediemonas membranifera TaxID=201153 RepID=A0A8J6B542_9EUKA|nr:hypothetical protein J8273_2765 [Carpediemonas membranifera]|eukprot:KAG9395853.1 hypothetical protein J8273_2765 [Carpediemonas membranifera]